MNKAVFLDKDGTLIDDVPYNVNPALIHLGKGVAKSLKALKDQGYLLIVISNQSGVAHGYFAVNALQGVVDKIQMELMDENVQLDAIYFCPHHPEGSVEEYAIVCECRKPKPGMILQAARRFNIDLSKSWMIGDILHDVEAGNMAGCKTILIDNGNETEWELNVNRKPTVIVKNIEEAASILLEKELETWKQIYHMRQL
jgi:D-glycero-D-manno-heptose 1,7-bisphosphate phosphatase